MTTSYNVAHSIRRFFASAVLLFAALFALIPVPSQATTGYAVPLRNAQLDAITTFVGAGGKLDLYDGTRPVTTCGALSGNNKLAEWTMGSPFAPAASAAVLSPTLPASTTGLYASTASWWRLYKSDGVTCVIDGSAGQSGADLNLNTTTVSVGVALSISSWSITRGNQ